MEINLLVVNVGNTRLAVGAFVAGELKAVQRVPLEDKGAWSSAITQAFAQISGRENAAVAGASVNPPMLEAVEHAISQATGLNVEWVGRELDLPIKVLTDHPEQTGVDRILATAAAYEQLQKACVVVDAGTALTVNCCNENGEFVGGAIAPGVRLQLQSLNDNTAKLPSLTMGVPTGSIGANTEQAILHGVYHGLRGLVREVAENYATDAGNWPEIIATGGDAKLLFDGWELIHAISPDLTLYGIALAFANHHIKHNS